MVQPWPSERHSASKRGHRTRDDRMRGEHRRGTVCVEEQLHEGEGSDSSSSFVVEARQYLHMKLKNLQVLFKEHKFGALSQFSEKFSAPVLHISEPAQS